MVKKAVILGFGTVGQGIYEVLHSHQQAIEEIIGDPIEIVGVLVRDGSKKRNINNDVLVTTNIDELLAIRDIEIVFEAIVGKEPCFTYLKKAIEKGCHVVTANKYMFAHYGRELLGLARDKGVSFRYEATVAGGVPIIGNLEKLMRTNEVYEIQGIVNGTCNYILSEMRTKRISFQDALKNAQDLGFAEADPEADIEGLDALYKFTILIQTIVGIVPSMEQIDCSGISSITLDQIQFVEALGLRFKHVIYYRQTKNTIDYWIRPVLVNSFHPFYQLDGVNNGIEVTGSIVGKVTFIGPGAGKLPTASAMVEDAVQIYDQPALFVKKNKKIWSMTKGLDEPKYWMAFCEREINHYLGSDVSIINNWNLKEQSVFVFIATKKQVQILQEKYSLIAYEVLSTSGIDRDLKIGQMIAAK